MEWIIILAFSGENGGKMSSIWELLSGLQGLDEAEMPWWGKLIAMLTAQQPDLRRGMYSAYGEAPDVGTRSSFADINELQDIMSKAQKEETVSDPRFNLWLRQNIPSWVQPQTQDYQNLPPELQRMVYGWAAAPGEERTEMEPYGRVSLANWMAGFPRPEQPLRIFAPYGREKRGYEMDKLGAEATKREAEVGAKRKFEEEYPGTDPEFLQFIKKVAGVEGVRRRVPGLGPVEEPKKPKLPAEWLKAPEKRRATIQEWVADWKKYIFTSWKKRGETGNFENLSYIEKRTHFSEWSRRIPVTLREEIAKRVGLATPLEKLAKPSPPEEKPEYTQEQMDGYNACRDRGGTKEECKVEAGF